MTEICSKCGRRPCDPNIKKPLCTDCAIVEMRAFREATFKRLKEEY